MKIIAAALALALSACCTPGGWMGLEKELAYDRQLERQRLTAGLNNDDYYEYHLRGRIYVLSDESQARTVLAGEEVPLSVTRVAAGPRGETLVFGVPHAERHKKTGFGAVELYERRREGAEAFYGEVFRNGVFYVFDGWDALEHYRDTRRFPARGASASGDRRMALFSSDAPGVRERFRALRGPAEPPIPPGCVCSE